MEAIMNVNDFYKSDFELLSKLADIKDDNVFFNTISSDSSKIREAISNATNLPPENKNLIELKNRIINQLNSRFNKISLESYLNKPELTWFLQIKDKVSAAFNEKIPSGAAAGSVAEVDEKLEQEDSRIKELIRLDVTSRLDFHKDIVTANNRFADPNLKFLIRPSPQEDTYVVLTRDRVGGEIKKTNFIWDSGAKNFVNQDKITIDQFYYQQITPVEERAAKELKTKEIENLKNEDGKQVYYDKMGSEKGKEILNLNPLLKLLIRKSTNIENTYVIMLQDDKDNPDNKGSPFQWNSAAKDYINANGDSIMQIYKIYKGKIKEVADDREAWARAPRQDLAESESKRMHESHQPLMPTPPDERAEEAAWARASVEEVESKATHEANKQKFIEAVKRNLTNDKERERDFLIDKKIGSYFIKEADAENKFLLYGKHWITLENRMGMQESFKYEISFEDNYISYKVLEGRQRILPQRRFVNLENFLKDGLNLSIPLTP